MSDSFCGMSYCDVENSSAVSTRWGTFVVDLPSSANSNSDGSSECDFSWVSRGSNHSPTPSSAEDLLASGRFDSSEDLAPQAASQAAQSGPVPEDTTSQQVMVKNILNRYNKKEFMEFLDSVGLKGAYNGLYLPIGRTRKGKTSNLGYAFLDLKGQDEVDLCRSLLNGMVMGTPGQQKCIEIAPVTTQHPSKKFHKCSKKVQEEQEQGQIDVHVNVDDVATSCLGTLSYTHDASPGFFSQPCQAQISTIRPPPGLELPNADVVGEAGSFCPPFAPLGECDHFHSQVRMPQVNDKSGPHLRHLAPLADGFAIQACHGCFSV
eukprot:CAMPEP_0206461396 /NCGR_PEP_ID=MMETSP0324_2-20121206/25339_1 /ASSEMBLY_ACC=CAM_ASM_000836 /TAXON_ID=2866 /ORGANISM="Crypthecodinium cohnii, Strain Seligo" /LENGTH=319 /DNA_ID=CAMNT_0053933315 /DNA_START=9 /DNA_END=967 /DNA_ORIENTATION=+